MALKNAKLDQTWASLMALAQNLPQNLAASLASATEEVELLQRKAELLEVRQFPVSVTSLTVTHLLVSHIP